MLHRIIAETKLCSHGVRWNDCDDFGCRKFDTRVGNSLCRRCGKCPRGKKHTAEKCDATLAAHGPPPPKPGPHETLQKVENLKLHLANVTSCSPDVLETWRTTWSAGQSHPDLAKYIGLCAPILVGDKECQDGERYMRPLLIKRPRDPGSEPARHVSPTTV